MLSMEEIEKSREAARLERQRNEDAEAAIRHRLSMAQRWFGYYNKSKDPQKKFKLIDQYNFLAQQRQR